MDEREMPISSNIRDGETPSRCELLCMVKKYSNFSESTSDDQDASDAKMDERFWHEVLDMYFVRGVVSKEKLEDDLIFFVRNMGLNGYNFKGDSESGASVFVRRFAPKNPSLRLKQLSEFLLGLVAAQLHIWMGTTLS